MNQSWDLLDIDGWEKMQARRRAQPEPLGFAVPQTERQYFNLDPWQRRALARGFQKQVGRFTNKAGMADLLDTRKSSCAPCAAGNGLGFLPGSGDGGGGGFFDWGWIGDWFGGGGPSIDPGFDWGGGGGGGSPMLIPDDCGRPADHPSYGCPCGSLFSGYDVGCINPCEEGWQVETRTIRRGAWDDPNATIEYIEECKPTAAQGALVCPTGTVKNGAYCVDPSSNASRPAVPPRGTPDGGGNPGPRTSPPGSRGAPPTGATAAQLAAAIAQARAICQRTGRIYDQSQRRCVGGATGQNPFGVLQNQVGGVPVWGWAAAAIAAAVLLRGISR